MSTFRTESADAKTSGSRSAAQARQDMIEADRKPPIPPVPAGAGARSDASAPKTLSAAAAREAMVQRNSME